MKLTYLIAASGIALVLSTGAQATVVGSLGHNASGPVSITTAGLAGGSVATLAGGSIFTADNVYADIPKDSIFGGSFLAAGPNTSPLATLTFGAGYNYLSFLWGSPDVYNVLNITTSLGAVQSFTAQSLGISSLSGDQTVSQYVQFSTAPGEYLSKVSFSNNPAKDAFEVANFRVGAVPEPATWAMMMMGFGSIGVAMRRRSRKVAVSYA